MNQTTYNEIPGWLKEEIKDNVKIDPSVPDGIVRQDIPVGDYVEHMRTLRRPPTPGAFGGQRK